MKIPKTELKPGDVVCVGGQIGEFRGLSGKKKQVCYRPYGGDSTRCVTPRPPNRGELVAPVRTDKWEEWVEVEN